MDAKKIPNRVAHVVHALLEASGPYAFNMGMLKTSEIMQYDLEALSVFSTRSALQRAMKLGLVHRVSWECWIPAEAAYNIRGELEDRFLSEVYDDPADST